MVVSGVAYEIELDVSSDTLKTDKNFDFEVVTDLAVNITVDFDLSQSIVVTGDGEYKIKPVLHINETQEAATICGSIEPLDVGEDPYDVTVAVTRNFDSDSSIYTVVTVARDSEVDSAQFCIFWLVPLVPNATYTVDIEQNGTVVYTDDVFPVDLIDHDHPGETILRGPFHHLARVDLHAVPGGDDADRGIDCGQRRYGLAGETG